MKNKIKNGDHFMVRDENAERGDEKYRLCTVAHNAIAAIGEATACFWTHAITIKDRNNISKNELDSIFVNAIYKKVK